MNKDIRILVDYADHRKTKKMVRRLGEEAVRCHLRLLSYAAKYKPRGILSDMSKEDIVDAAGWTGDVDKFVDTLVEIKLLDKKRNKYEIHDWKDHNAYAFHAPERSERARHAANIKHGKEVVKVPIVCGSHAGRSAAGSAGRRRTDAPSPSPKPSPKPKQLDITSSSNIPGHRYIDSLFLKYFKINITKPDFESLMNGNGSYPGYDSVKRLEFAIKAMGERFQAKNEVVDNPVGLLVDLYKEPGKYLNDKQIDGFKRAR